ncbi:acyl carrier protein [Streptomyces sp. NPDC048636]|uniref:acyl carrier protein n=1 Tax=Streptomyces sp. NPDC048636 TaxID=3155762 RepID=UPI00344A1EFF
MITPRLCGAAYELGEYADPVGELAELRAAPRLAAELTSPAAGFVRYRWSEAPVTELMTAAVQRTLAAAGVPGAGIDMVLLATDSLPAGRAAHRDVAELLQETGMSRATVSTLGLMDCATAMAAVGTAASLVRDGTARQVLVVSGDLADLSTGGQRVVAGGAAIASDGAASVLVSADAPGLPVLAMAHHADPEQEWGGGPPPQQLASRIRAYRELFERLAAHHPVPPATSLVLPSHFARHVMRMYLADVGFPADRIALDGVARLAHCQGSDPLITLADLLAEPKPADAGRAADPERLVLLGAGISHLAAVLLDARPVPRLEGGSP